MVDDATMSLFDPGTDLTAEAVRAIFPLAPGASGIGEASTVLATLLGTLSGAACIVMIALVFYGATARTVAAAETGMLRGNGRFSWMTWGSVFFAAIMAMPLPSGYTSGHALVSMIGMSGLGLGTNLAKAGVTQIGPAAQAVFEPMVPGVKRTVSAFIQNELCRALVNAAAGNDRMAPAPRPIGGTNADGHGYHTWSYDLAPGNATGAPVCGSVTVRVKPAVSNSMASVDVSTQTRDAVTAVLEGTIRPAVTGVAQALWQNRQASSLGALMGVLTSASAQYTAQLRQIATNATADLRGRWTAETMRQGDFDAAAGMMQMSEAGFSGLGAYYTRLAHLSGLTMSLLGDMPQVVGPSYQGLGYYLSGDLAPLVQAARQFQARLDAYVAVNDPTGAPGGGADVLAGAAPAAEGPGVIEWVLRKMDISESLLRVFIGYLAPASSAWNDPFTALMRMGSALVSVALVALAAAAALSSTPVSTGLAAWNLLTFNFAGAAATITGSTIMGFLGTPIFYGLMALLVPGLVLAFVVPMVPAVMWTLGILNWLILFVEAMIAVPLWALAHATLDGVGFHGRGLRGWGIMLKLLVQPALMVVAFFTSYWLFTFISRYIFLFFYAAASFPLSQGWLLSNLLGFVVMLCMFTLLHTVAELQCFRVITLLSVHVPAWVGVDSPDRMDSHSLAQDATMIGLATSLQEVRRGMVTLTSRVGDQNGGAGEHGALPSQQRQLGMDRTVAAATDTGPVAAREGAKEQAR